VATGYVLIQAVTGSVSRGVVEPLGARLVSAPSAG
jgi:hypothetical protein